MKLAEIKNVQIFLFELQEKSGDVDLLNEYLIKLCENKNNWDWIYAAQSLGIIIKRKMRDADEPRWVLPCNYILKEGVLLQAFSDASKSCTNINLTDELAEWHLGQNEDAKKLLIKRKPYDEYLFELCDMVDVKRKTNEPLPLFFQKILKIEQAEIIKKQKEEEIKKKKAQKEKAEREKEEKQKDKKKKKKEAERLIPLKDFTDEDLAVELKNRGFVGGLEYKKNLKI